MIIDRLAFLAWLALLGLCLNYGRRVAPWLEGPARGMLAWGLGMAGAWGLAWGCWLWIRLAPGRRGRAAWQLALIALGLGVLAWAQPLLIERVHLLLYGVLGVLAYRLYRRRPGPWRRFAPAAALASLVGVADELVQALHPERVGDPRDAVTNACAAVLLAWAACLLDPGEA